MNYHITVFWKFNDYDIYSLKKNLANQENKIKKLKFDNDEYNFDDLPENAKSLLNGLQTVDLQLKMYGDTINLLKVSKNSMLNDMKNILKDIQPIDWNSIYLFNQ